MSNYSVTTYTDNYMIYELAEEHTSSRVCICPERGGIVTSHIAGGKELLYMDKQTFYDPQANIRGGIPVLFPICGQLADGSYEWQGRKYSMKNHGVARISPWEAIGTKQHGEASVTLKLGSDEASREQFPFDFELVFTYTLKNSALHILQEYRNLSDTDMPMYAGFHPYFAADSKNISYETDARLYYDYNDNEQKPFTGSLDLSEMVESAALLGAENREISFRPSSDRVIRMKYSEHFKYVVLWSVPGKPFVCVEPWMALTSELNRKQELVLVKPNETLRAELSVSCDTAHA
ncbi:aldose epimerase family protein [Paenibacillus alkalitolerans]|uniref:aldose epimerase family protein n=1 Tax=Paenibacillus alkalitolerans TaxID=2799335 RepID=UPI0018F4DD17|nr:aldose epimerase [Paenibacillus alkalitolerans]